jgi:hypothetical protein
LTQEALHGPYLAPLRRTASVHWSCHVRSASPSTSNDSGYTLHHQSNPTRRSTMEDGANKLILKLRNSTHLSFRIPQVRYKVLQSSRLRSHCCSCWALVMLLLLLLLLLRAICFPRSQPWLCGNWLGCVRATEAACAVWYSSTYAFYHGCLTLVKRP